MENELDPLEPLVSDAAVVDKALKVEPPFNLTPSTEEGICVAGRAGPLNVAAAAFTVTAQGRLDFTCRVEALALVRPFWYSATSLKEKLVPVAEEIEMLMAFCRFRVTVWLAVEVDWALAAVKAAKKTVARVRIFFMVGFFVCVLCWYSFQRRAGVANG